MNRVKVVICGKEYFLKTEEDATYIYNLARALDKRINMIMDNAHVSSQSASVMVALSLLDDLKHLDKEYNDLKQSAEDVAKIAKERDNALLEIENLKETIAELQNNATFKNLGTINPVAEEKTSKSTNKSKK